MATWNGALFISEQLQSIINQLSSTDEIIISDDGSTDDTLSIVRSFQDERIKIFEVNFRSPSKNFEHAISQAKGDFIFLADQDDLWLNNKVAICTSLLRKYDVVITDCNIIDETGRQTAPSLFKQIHSGSGVIKNLLSNTYYGCCMCFNRKIKDIIYPFPTHVPMHDIWIGFVGGLFYRVLFVKQVLVSYRRHQKNHTFITKSKAPLIIKLKRRLNLVRYYPLLLIRRWKLRAKM